MLVYHFKMLISDCGKRIRPCQLWENAENSDCFVWKTSQNDGTYTGRLTYPFLSQTINYQDRKSVWLTLENPIQRDALTINDLCDSSNNNDCWSLDKHRRNIENDDTSFEFIRGPAAFNSRLDVVDITMHLNSDDLSIESVYLCEPHAMNIEPIYPQEEPEAPSPPQPSGQWDKCEEIPICTIHFQPAGWTYQGYYQRVACYEQGAFINGDGDIRIRQSEFEKTNRFNTNSALWILGSEDFNSDTIADQCERDQENGCWRAIGKGERLFKVMRGWNDGNTTLDTTVLNVDGSAERMIICDADQHSFDVDEPDMEAVYGHPYMKNKYCMSGIMWHNSEGEAAQRWTLSEEKFTDLSATIDAEKIYTDGNGRYLYWEWIGFSGRWKIST